MNAALIRFRDGPLQGETVAVSGEALADLGGWPLPHTLGVNDESGEPAFAPIDDSERGRTAAREASYAYSKTSESRIPDGEVERMSGVIRGAEYTLDRQDPA